MISLQASLTMARKALQAQQVAIQTTGHNIANANTPGFTRQRVDLTPAVPFSLGSVGSLGTGVDIKDITRIRDLLLDSQFRDAHQALSRQEAEEATLSQIELIVGERPKTACPIACPRFSHRFRIWPTIRPISRSGP